VDWDTVFNVQGNPEIKALFYTEYKREDGHADFIYLRRILAAREIEEKTRDKLVKQAIDKMMHPEKYVNLTVDAEADMNLTVDSEVDRKKRVEIISKEEQELNNPLYEDTDRRYNPNHDTTTVTTKNVYNCRFIVPFEVYLNPEYEEYLNCAKTMKSVKVIVDEYYRKYGKKKSTFTPKKTHWWQRI